MSATGDVNTAVGTIDRIMAELDKTRIAFTNAGKARKDARKAEIVAGGVAGLRDHIAALNTRLGKPYMPAVPADFGGAIKGKSSLAKMQDAVDTELANAKIRANEVADRIDANLKHMRETATEYAALFPDTATIVLKAPDDLQALVANRINAHQQQEAAKEEAQRERIRAEEAAKLQREADARARVEAQAQQVADEQRQHAARLEDERIKREQIEQVQAARIRDEELHSQAQAAIAAAAAPARVSPATPTDSGARLTLGQINERLEVVSVNTEQLARMGFTATVNRSARTYLESDFPRMCAVIQRHLVAVAQGVAA
jgi:uncharacterized protein YhaN